MLNLNNHRVEVMDELLMIGFDPKELLKELIKAMSDKEAKENLEFICRMNNIEVEGNDQ